MEIENRMDEEEAVMAPTDGENEAPEAKEEAGEIVLAPVDLMTFMFMSERGQRMDAEKRGHQAEFDAFVADINRKYGVVLTDSQIDLSTGVITPKVPKE